MNILFHKETALGKWFQFSLAEQLANIGSEVGRASKWQGKDENLFWGAANRALELFDLTLQDHRWRGRLKEIARVRELFCGALFGENNYNSSIKDIERYFLPFTFLARRQSLA